MTGIETLAAAGTLIGGAATISQTLYQGQVAQANAQQAQLNAQQAAEVAQQRAEDAGDENAAILAAQIASQGSSGLSLSSPTAIRSRFHSQELAFEDQKRIVEEGFRQNANFRTQANQFEATSRAAGTSAFLTAVGTGIGARRSFISGATPTRAGGFDLFTPKPLSRSRVFVR